jgi:hypothetical protein
MIVRTTHDASSPAAPLRLALVDWEATAVGSGPQDLGQFMVSHASPASRRALAPAALSRLLQDSAFGLLDYPLHLLAKSSVFAAYASHAAESVDAETLATLAERVDWITVTSSFIAASARRLFGDHLQSWKVASISPVTTAALVAVGVTPTVEAARPTSEALVAAITRWEAAHHDLAHTAGSAKSTCMANAPTTDRVDSGPAARR